MCLVFNISRLRSESIKEDDVVYASTEYGIVWKKLDEIIEEESRKQPPGTFINAYVFEEEAEHFVQVLKNELKRREGQTTVCEIGFNCGHSTAVWITTGGSRVRVFSFDLFNQFYSTSCRKVLSEEATRRGSTLTFIPGSSLDTIPAMSLRNSPPTCDLILVDGRHNGAYPINDLQNMLALASPHASILMDDARCTSWWCADVTNAWAWAVNSGFVEEERCFEYNYEDTRRHDGRIDPTKGSRGWCYGHAKASCPICPPAIGRDIKTCNCRYVLPGFPT